MNVIKVIVHKMDSVITQKDLIYALVIMVTDLTIIKSRAMVRRK